MAARISAASAPPAVSARTAFAVMPPSVPRQPECTAATAPLLRSQSSTGTQSAYRTDNSSAGVRVYSPSTPPSKGGSVRPRPASRSSTRRTVRLCVWYERQTRETGSPNTAAARAWFSSTFSAVSRSPPLPCAKLSDANTPAETPPPRSENRCGTPCASSSGEVRYCTPDSCRTKASVIIVPFPSDEKAYISL